jgi:uncharacterized protein
MTRPLAAIGRMAFTNYILQTILCTAIFYGHGFGVFGSVALDPATRSLLRFGPLEGLWRSLIDMQWESFRRAQSAVGIS